jgi:hypothetical protein
VVLFDGGCGWDPPRSLGASGGGRQDQAGVVGAVTRGIAVGALSRLVEIWWRDGLPGLSWSALGGSRPSPAGASPGVAGRPSLTLLAAQAKALPW